MDIHHRVYMLMHTVSSVPYESAMYESAMRKTALSVNFHKEYPKVWLLRPVCFCTGAVCHRSYRKRVEFDVAVDKRFGVNVTQNELEGSLLTELTRDLNNLKRGYYYGEKCTYIFIAWKMKDAKLFFHVALIEHYRTFN
jgi:hypothetical protein